MEQVLSSVSSMPCPPQEQAKWKEAEIVFGSPSRCCEGLGICTVSVALPRFIRCPRVKGRLSYLDSQKRLLFCFQKAAVTQPHIIHCLSQGIFIVEEAFCITGHLYRTLGLEKAWIAPGIYPVFSDSTAWYISFGVA